MRDRESLASGRHRMGRDDVPCVFLVVQGRCVLDLKERAGPWPQRDLS